MPPVLIMKRKLTATLDGVFAALLALAQRGR
jgi:hypothetical protein